MKKFKLCICILALTINLPASAAVSSDQLSFGSDEIMTQVLKEAVTVVGKHIIKKYTSQDNTTTTPPPATTQSNTQTGTTRTSTGSFGTPSTQTNNNDDDVIIVN